MILGNICTRSCRFCATITGNPRGKIDEVEPYRIAEYVRAASLGYLVITSVTRDDLPDGGASIFASVIEKVRNVQENIKIEVLIPDFAGSHEALKKVINAKPDVIGHNVESVERLSKFIRDPRASYYTSLKLLGSIKYWNHQAIIKSGFMLGLGENENDVIATMKDLRNLKVDILTLGQYLQPSSKHFPVAEYVTPEKFGKYENIGYSLGFKSILAGPLVRSSYRANEVMEKASGKC